MELDQDEQRLEQESSKGVVLTGLPVISHFEVLLAPIFPSSPGPATSAAAAEDAGMDPRRLPSPFRQLADAKDDGRGRTADRLAAAATVPRPEVLQGLFTLITNPTAVAVTVAVVLEVNSTADAQSIANDCLAFDLRTGAPTVGTWIAPAAQKYAYYFLSRQLQPGETTNLACIPNFLKNPAPTVSVRGLVSISTTSKQLYLTPEQRAVFYPTTASDVFSTVAYCLTTSNGTNFYSF